MWDAHLALCPVQMVQRASAKKEYTTLKPAPVRRPRTGSGWGQAGSQESINGAYNGSHPGTGPLLSPQRSGVGGQVWL